MPRADKHGRIQHNNPLTDNQLDVLADLVIFEGEAPWACFSRQTVVSLIKRSLVEEGRRNNVCITDSGRKALKDAQDNGRI
jgi:hypothetical protein